PLEVVAAIGVELGAATDRPAHLVGRMAANLGAGDRAGAHAKEASRQARAWGSGAEQGDRVSSVVAAADVMRRDHDLGTAPGLVHAEGLHDVGGPRLGL